MNKHDRAELEGYDSVDEYLKDTDFGTVPFIAALLYMFFWLAVVVAIALVVLIVIGLI